MNLYHYCSTSTFLSIIANRSIWLSSMSLSNDTMEGKLVRHIFDILVTVFVHSMDRLARNLGDLRKIVQDLTKRGIKITFVKESLTFTGDDSPMATLLLNIMGSVAEFEKMVIKERVLEGIAIAKTKGVYKGRKKSLNQSQIVTLKERVSNGEKKSVIARDMGISRETLYQYMKQQ